MGRAILSGLAMYLIGGAGWAQVDAPPDSRTVVGGGNTLLSSGADAIRAGSYDEGIRLTVRGLERRDNNDRDRAAGLSNLCAAYAAKREPDTAISYCTESLTLNASNWRAHSNRAYAYWLKGMYPEASLDIDAASALNPRAEQVLEIRAMINEATLRPRITLEEHQ